MIAERCAALEVLLAKKQELAKDVTLLKEFGKREKDLVTALGKIRPLFEAARAFERRGLTVNPGDRPAALKARIDDVRNRFQSSPDSILDEAQFGHALFESAVGGLVESLRKSLGAAWRDYAKDKVPVLKEDLLDVLKKIKTAETAVQRIRTIRDRIVERLPKFPTSEAEFVSFETLVADLQAAWSAVGLDDAPPSVQTFMKAVGGTRGAPLDAFHPVANDEVYDWLKRHGILGSFSIRISN